MLLAELEAQAREELESYITIKNVLVKKENIKAIPDIDITIDYITARLGRKWRRQLVRMYPVVQWFSHHSNPTMFSVTMLREMRNGKSRVNGYYNSSMALNDLISLGLIKCIEKHYNPDNKQARLYTFNYSNLNSLINLINSLNLINQSYINSSYIDCPPMFRDSTRIDNGLEEWITESRDDDSISELDDVNCESLNIERHSQEQLINDDSINQLINQLQLRQLIKIQNELELDVQFKYNLGQNALRPYSPFCSLPTREKSHVINHPIYREDVLNEKMPGWREFDRIASIYNLNRFIKKGEITGNNRALDDFYKEFSGCTTKEERANVKTIMMTLMFGSAQQFNSSARAVVDYYLKKDNRSRKKALKFVERFIAIGRLMGLETINTYNTVKKMNAWRREQVKKLESLIGKRIGKTIFLYEAFVNLSTEIALRQAGFECKTVYDGFYTNADESTWWKLYTQSLQHLNSLLNTNINSYIDCNYIDCNCNDCNCNYINYIDCNCNDCNCNCNCLPMFRDSTRIDKKPLIKTTIEVGYYHPLDE